MDIFRRDDLQTLLHNKFVVIIGDSIQRAVYKDLIAFLQKDEFVEERELKLKGERSHRGDILLEGGQLAEMNNRKTYREVRQWQHKYHLVRFYFVTRCYSDYMETVLQDLSQEPQPDLVIMNSCLWDITRYGPRSMEDYQVNLQLLFKRVREVLPKETLFVWHTAMPLAEKIRGGFFIEQIDFMNDVIRVDVMIGNFHAAKAAHDHGMDVLDLHFHFRSMLEHRKKDGVHWDARVHRRISNMLMKHVASAWRYQLPSRVSYFPRYQPRLQDDRRPDGALLPAPCPWPEQRVFNFHAQQQQHRQAFANSVAMNIPTQFHSMQQQQQQRYERRRLSPSAAAGRPSYRRRNHPYEAYRRHQSDAVQYF